MQRLRLTLLGVGLPVHGSKFKVQGLRLTINPKPFSCALVRADMGVL